MGLAFALEEGVYVHGLALMVDSAGGSFWCC